MKLNIRGKNLKITSAMKEYAEVKFKKLEKYLKDTSVEPNLLFKIYGNKQKLEITIPVKNLTLRVEEVGEDFYSTVDTALDKLERIIIKNKTRLQSKKMRDKYNFSFDKLEEDFRDLEPNKNKIIKRKTLELKPMDEDEAILQMELLGHDFYIFKDKDDKKTCVLYKRKNDGYGLIKEE